MTILEHRIADTKKRIKDLATDLNILVEAKARARYEWELCYVYDEHGTSYIQTNDYGAKLRSLEKETIKLEKELEAVKSDLATQIEALSTDRDLEEEWTPVNICDGIYASYYEVSDKGNVRSYWNGKWGTRNAPKLLRPSNPTSNVQYRTVNLKSEATDNKSYTVHFLVASAFIPNPNNYPCINHKDGNKKNNCVDNLEWCTHAMNMKHASRNGLMKSRKIREIATGKIFNSILEASRVKGCNPASIYATLDGYEGRKKGEPKYETVV